MNAEMVKPRMAGVYDRGVTDRVLYQVQKKAQFNRRGLWTEPAPMPPREWRRSEGAARAEIIATTDAGGLSGSEILNAGRYRGVYMVQSAR